MRRRPAIVVIFTPGRPVAAHAIAETWEDEQRLRATIVERADLVGEVVVALGRLLELLDEAAEGTEAA